MQRTTPPDLRDATKRLAPQTARNVLFVMVGVAGLVLKGRYAGPAQDLVHSYGGNVAASFAVYFWARLATASFLAADRARRGQQLGRKLARVLAAGLALLVVQLFELFDGFGVMTNVYDRADLVANTAGIAIAFALDAAMRRAGRRQAGIETTPTSAQDPANPRPRPDARLGYLDSPPAGGRGGARLSRPASRGSDHPGSGRQRTCPSR